MFLRFHGVLHMQKQVEAQTNCLESPTNYGLT